MIFREIRRRLYSDDYFYILYRNISLPPRIPEPENPVSLRPVRPDDIPKLLDLNEPGLDKEAMMERIRLLRLLKAGIQEAHVAVTENDTPCHISWLMNSTQNPKIKSFYKGRVLPLAPEEVLIEGAFTLEAYRKKGIQRWRRFRFFEKSLAVGARRVINYVRHDNIPSLKSCASAGYVLFMIRKDQWRFFRRSFSFRTVPESTSYPLENGKITNLDPGIKHRVRHIHFPSGSA